MPTLTPSHIFIRFKIPQLDKLRDFKFIAGRKSAIIVIKLSIALYDQQQESY